MVPMQVGTSDAGPRMRSMALLVMLRPNSNIALHTFSIDQRCTSVSTHAFFVCTPWSFFVPSLQILSFVTRQHGQGQLPRNFMHARSILYMDTLDGQCMYRRCVLTSQGNLQRMWIGTRTPAIKFHPQTWQRSHIHTCEESPSQVKKTRWPAWARVCSV